MIIEGIMKGMAIWLYNLLLDTVEFIADALLVVFTMDLSYFESNVPVTGEIISILLGAGWALLIGNLTFQAIKSMMTGIGFEGEDPKMLFTRTFVFSFLLLASRQICTIGLNMTSALNTLMQTPSAVDLGLPQLDIFAYPGSWLLVIIIGVILMFQLIRFFFEMAERYVVLVILTLFAPLAFGVGGSKNTEDIFKGWARMYGSACLMMVFNTVFLKLLLSAMSNMPGGTDSTAALLPWTLLVVGIAKVARKIDDMVARVGLNTARTGDKLGLGGLMYPIMVMRSMSGIMGKTIGGTAKAASKTPKSGTRGGGTPMPPPPPSSPAGSGGNSPNSPSGGSGGATTPPSPSGPAAGGAPYPGTDNNAQPARPPVGVHSNGRGGNGNQAPEQGHPHTPAGQAQPVNGGTSVGGNTKHSAVDTNRRHGETRPQSDGRGNDNKNRTGVQRSGGTSPDGIGEGNDRIKPPLSTDTRSPGVSAQKPAPDGKANQKGNQFGKKVNLDIYRDDDPPVRPAQTRPAARTGARLAVTQSGGAVKQAAAAPAAGTAAAGAGKAPAVNMRTTGTEAVQKGARNHNNQPNTGQPKTVKPQIPSVPVNASSPSGGRLSGGVTDPSGSHRAPSRAAPTSSSGTSSAMHSEASRTRRTMSESSQVNSSTTSSHTDRSNAGPSSPAGAGIQHVSQAVTSSAGKTQTTARYRIAGRTILERDGKSGYQPYTRRAAGQTNYGAAGHSAREKHIKDNRPSSGNRSVPPASTGRPAGGNPPAGKR